MPPHHGLATRIPPVKDAKTARGFSIYKGIIVYHESKLEQRVSTVLQARNDVEQLHSQYPVLRWRGKHGKYHKHICDYCVFHADGSRTAVVVKNERKRAVMEEVIRRMKDEDFSSHADDIALLTNVDATHDRAANAEAILWSRTVEAEAEVEVVHRMVDGMAGQIRFGELLRGAPKIGYRRAAIWKLIDRGILIPEDGVRVNELTWLVSSSSPLLQLAA
ncbi:hypothetical protein [Sinorhizobium fredii]|uniref:hypothetical protein n=1 Tax=Rhizobium fredii TaxID=380 RepID=UPI00117D6D2C|nr:hypothetical protein [Sinorhizobium fredii]